MLCALNSEVCVSWKSFYISFSFYHKHQSARLVTVCPEYIKYYLQVTLRLPIAYQLDDKFENGFHYRIPMTISL